MAELPERRKAAAPDYGAWVARGALFCMVTLSLGFIYSIYQSIEKFGIFADAARLTLHDHGGKIADHTAILKEHAERMRLMEWRQRASMPGSIYGTQQ